MTETNENTVATEATAVAEPTVAEVAAVGELIEIAKSDPEGSVTVTGSDGTTTATVGKKPRSKETKPRVRLTEEQALEILAKYAKGSGVSQKDLAKEYNVTQGAISHIVTGKRWARLKKSEPAADESTVTPEPTTTEADA